MSGERAREKDKVWLAVAHEVSRLSTCNRLRVGCVLLRSDSSVAGVGYNGSLPGDAHCGPECGPGARCLRTRHAERSALDYSAGPLTVAYVTHEPCLSCTRDLAARGVRRVVFSEPYEGSLAEATERGRLLAERGIVWIKLDKTR